MRIRPRSAFWIAAMAFGLPGGWAYISYHPRLVAWTTQRAMTGVDRPDATGRAPINQFSHIDPRMSADPGEPLLRNDDVLHSTAWLDLREEPMVLRIPPTGGRYFSVQMIDAWFENFAYVGLPGADPQFQPDGQAVTARSSKRRFFIRRSTGDDGGAFVITGPGWTGSLPEGVSRIGAPTYDVWLIVRTATGLAEGDRAKANAMRAAYSLTPLSRYDG